MWHTIHVSSKTDYDFAGSAKELTQSSMRSLMLVSGGTYVVWHIIATATWPQMFGARLWFLTMVLAMAYGLALGLLPRHLLAAHAVWQVGLMVAITLAVYLFRQPTIAFFYALLPFMAMVLMGWPVGLLVEGSVVVLSLLLDHRLSVLPSASPHAAAIAVAGAIASLVGWASSRALHTVAQWSLYGLDQARKNMAEAREQRAKYVKVVKDLDQAYYRLQRANAALLVAWRAADEAERSRAEFATHVSHEFRTPLNLIVGFADMMVASPESYGGAQIPGPYRRDLEVIYHSAQHLLTLVDDVLDLARIEVGKIALNREEVDLASLVTEVRDMVCNYVAAKGVEFRVKVEEGLPRLWIDRLRIRQVLLNLLVNAGRFTDQGHIGIDVSQQGEEVVVRVTDTGRGIPEEELPRVFEEFHPTGQPPSGWHGSSGLGLPISKKLVELHHGRMGVESALRRGTTFWFALPCALGSALELEAGRLTPVKPAIRLVASERIVVVVNRDPGIPRLLQRHLDGYRILGAGDAAEGAKLAQETKAIALMTDGQEPVPIVSADLPIVSCLLPTSRQAARELGAEELLVKPVSRQELLTAINRLGRPVQRVLIADDDPEMVHLLQRMLYGCIPAQGCLKAYTGAEALGLARSGKPDLLLLDLSMPDTSGPEVLREMAADPELVKIPVILISGRADEYITWRLPGHVQVSKGEGFGLGEVTKVLEAIFGSLGSGWH